ncbi:MAG: iron ABC transporter permease [Planctomycetales bacterium]|nr:iron ABC transporter permease [Planctomycetales bacterium]
MKTWRLVTCLVVLGFLLGVLGLAAGPSGWRSPWEAAGDLFSGDEVVARLRAPRVTLAAILGASLALAGSLMQVLLRNDLADPYVLGLSGGASLGAVTSLALWPGLPPGPAAAAGAAGAAVVVRGVARGAHDPARLLLAGVAVGSLLASATGLVLVLAPADRVLRSATFWLFGGLGTPLWPALGIPAVLLAGCVGWGLVRAERLDRLTLGDDLAAALGVDVPGLRREALVVAVLLTACAVAVGGLVGFVGLVAPHVGRQLAGAPHRGLIPVAVGIGALLVVVADTVARTAFAPREVPVGLLTAAVGGPFFLWLLQRGRR